MTPEELEEDVKNCCRYFFRNILQELEKYFKKAPVISLLIIVGFVLVMSTSIFELAHRFTFFLFKFTDVFDFFGSRNPTSQVKQANDVYCKYTIMHH